MKTIIKSAFVGAICGCLSAGAAPPAAQEKLPVRHLIQQATLAGLTSADTNAPATLTGARHYFLIKVDTCTNTAQLQAISNSIALHK